MRPVQLFTKLTLYYLLVAAVVLAALQLLPGARELLPIGGVETLMSNPTTGFDRPVAVNPAATGDLGETLAWLVITIAGALLTAIPVSWIYIAVRDHENYDQSLVDTIIVLPIVVTSIVIIVQNSLALAFSIAGIAAAVRFRNSLKSSGDALFILLSVGIGLSAGIGALELAIVMSVAFNYCFFVLWITGYGERQGMRRYLEQWEQEEPPPPAS